MAIEDIGLIVLGMVIMIFLGACFGSGAPEEGGPL